MLSNKKHRNPYDANLRHDYHTTRKAFKKLIKCKKSKHLNSQSMDASAYNSIPTETNSSWRLCQEKKYINLVVNNTDNARTLHLSRAQRINLERQFKIYNRHANFNKLYSQVS